jgi:hypothetical protein
MLNYTDSTSSTHSINKSTGAIDNNPSNFFVFPEYSLDYYIEDGYLYVLSLDSYESARCYMYIYNLSDLSNYVDSVSISFDGDNIYRASFIKKNGTLYITAHTSYSYEHTGSDKCACSLNHNGTYYNDVNTYYKDYTNIATLPSGLSSKNCLLGMCGNYEVIYVFSGTENSNSIRYNFYDALLFTDCEDTSTLVDVIPYLRCTDIVWNNSTSYGVIGLLYNSYIYTYDGYNKVDTEGYRNIITTGDGTAITANKTINDYGTLFSEKGDFGNFMSLVKLSEPVEKTETAEITVTYKYQLS